MRNYVFNETMKLRRQTLVKIAKLYLEGRLEKELPKLNKTLLPGPNPTYRSSLYHEREVLKQRIKLYLGLDYEKTKEFELFEISQGLKEASLDSFFSEKSYIQVIKEACDGCPSGKYFATDLCRNCVAHSCKTVCPKNAITIDKGRASIDNELCVGCGLCAKACNYFAIVKLERPCERACGVSAITSDSNNAAEINKEKCISCGACHVACPFGAIETPSALLNVIELLKKKEKVKIIYAPAIAGQFGPKVKTGQIKNALLELGFSSAYEASLGADFIAKEEAEYLEDANGLVTSSCCPAFVKYIEKHQRDFVKNISPSLSPMAHLAKELESPEEKTIFVGPCIAKKNRGKKI